MLLYNNMARTSTQALTSLTRCVNKICLKQKDILQTQDYILESHGWDRKCDPVCFTISGPATGPGLDQFELLSGGTAANLLFSDTVYSTTANYIKQNALEATSMIFKPNVKVCTYLQPNDNLIVSALKHITDISSQLTGGYQFICEQGGVQLAFNVPDTGPDSTAPTQDYIAVTLSEDCVLSGETGTAIGPPS
jgi:hypothetical protein